MECGLEIKLGCQDRTFWEFLLSGDGSIDSPLDACAKHAWEEFFRDHAAVDRRPVRPFITLVVGEAILLDNSPEFVDGWSAFGCSLG